MIGSAALGAATCAGVSAAAGCAWLLPPTRRLEPRLRPYVQLARSRLGLSADLSAPALPGPAVSASTLGALFGPMLGAAARRLSALLDAGDDEALRLRLRQGGFAETSPDQYRMRQLAWTTGAASAGATLGLVVTHGAAGTLVLAGAGATFGATRWRGRVSSAIEARRRRMRIELYTAAHLLAMLIRTGHGPLQSVRLLVARGRGPVIEELGEALAWAAGGMGEVEAFERLAADTPEPAAARVYRLLASGIAAGGDLGTALLAMSDDLRAERREQLEREATRRRGAMLIPTIAIMAPVVLLFVAAPLPSLIFGAR